MEKIKVNAPFQNLSPSHTYHVCPAAPAYNFSDTNLISIELKKKLPNFELNNPDVETSCRLSTRNCLQPGCFVALLYNNSDKLVYEEICFNVV